MKKNNNPEEKQAAVADWGLRLACQVAAQGTKRSINEGLVSHGTRSISQNEVIIWNGLANEALFIIFFKLANLHFNIKPTEGEVPPASQPPFGSWL